MRSYIGHLIWPSGLRRGPGVLRHDLRILRHDSRIPRHGLRIVRQRRGREDVGKSGLPTPGEGERKFLCAILSHCVSLALPG